MNLTIFIHVFCLEFYGYLSSVKKSELKRPWVKANLHNLQTK